MAIQISNMDKPINCRWYPFRQGSDEDSEGTMQFCNAKEGRRIDVDVIQPLLINEDIELTPDWCPIEEV